MLVEKITHGHVTQVFDTETGQLVKQSFTASCDVDWETEEGEPLDINHTDPEELHSVKYSGKYEYTDLYHIFGMIQPKSNE